MSTGVDVFMPFYIGDYLKDTADLTAEEHGAYLLLLMHLWNRGGELTSDPCRLARLAAVDADRWPAVWGAIGRFFSVQNGTITQGRLYHELKKAEERRRLASEAGKASAEARAQRSPNPPHNARVNGTATEAPTESQPDGQRNGNGKATLHSSHSHSESEPSSESEPPPPLSSASPSRASRAAPEPAPKTEVVVVADAVEDEEVVYDLSEFYAMAREAQANGFEVPPFLQEGWTGEAVPVVQPPPSFPPALAPAALWQRLTQTDRICRMAKRGHAVPVSFEEGVLTVQIADADTLSRLRESPPPFDKQVTRVDFVPSGEQIEVAA